MNINLCLKTTFFALLLISGGAYAANNPGGDSQTPTTQQGTENEGISNHSDKGITSMQTSTKGMSGENGHHHKHHHGWRHGEGDSWGVGYNESYEGEYCRMVPGHYNHFGDWIPKHRVCYGD